MVLINFYCRLKCWFGCIYVCVNISKQFSPLSTICLSFFLSLSLSVFFVCILCLWLFLLYHFISFLVKHMIIAPYISNVINTISHFFLVCIFLVASWFKCQQSNCGQAHYRMITFLAFTGREQYQKKSRSWLHNELFS